MAVPAAVKKAEEQARKLAAEKGMRGTGEDPAVRPAPAQPTPIRQPNPPPTAGLTPTEEPAPAPAVQDPTPQPAGDPQLQARYDALRGKYDAEVPRLSQQVKELSGRLDEALQVNSDLTNKLKTAHEAPPEWAGHIDALGNSLGDPNLPEVLNGLRSENQQLRQELRDRDAKIDGLVTRLDGIERTTARETESRIVSDRNSFYKELNKRVPNWQAIGKDRGFVQYMYEPDPYARRLGRTDGATRQDILSERAKDLDIDAVVAYYDDYLQLQQQGSADRQSALRESIGPDDSGAGGTHVRSDKEIIPQSYINDFNRDVQNNRYAGREEEYRRIDQAIFEAQREGRVDPRR